MIATDRLLVSCDVCGTTGRRRAVDDGWPAGWQVLCRDSFREPTDRCPDCATGKAPR